MNDDLLARLKEALADRYAVEEELGQGGMAIVYLARDLRHDREVAIKVLHPSLSATLGTERFLREIDVVAKLVHPNILTLIDSGAVGDLPYYVMPFVKGQSLAALLEREGPLSLEEAVRITCEVAEALEVAHQHGVIHRDIKPSNVLLSGGHAVVADFGIAAALDDSKLSRLTRTGTSIGSPAYMSPEQAGGERELDGRADIYSLGCMLYEMLGGEAPFQGSLEAMVTRKVLGEVRPLREVNPEVPPTIEKVVEKALEKEPDRRYPTAEAFREALLAAVPKEAPKGWGRRRTVATAAVVLVVAASAVAAVAQNRRAGERRLWAAQTLAQVEGLFQEGHLSEALELAEDVEAVYPHDTTLARLLPLFSITMAIRTDPPGARVHMQEWTSAGGDWEFLGVTPLEEVRFAGTGTSGEDRPHRLRFELEGHQTRELLKTAVLGYRTIPPMDPVELLPADPELEGMVPIPAFTRDSVEYAGFFMDRFEVTNREFKEFVDAGGYRDTELWTHPFVRDGLELSFEEATALFRDQSGRPGPSTWSLGNFPEGQADFPVGGVSWHEAAAYARWMGKDLPTTVQWQQSRPYYRANSYVIAPRSNLDSGGPRPVGQNQAMTTLGLYDLAGNVREWCYNEVGEGERATRGAAWPEASFHVGWVIPKPVFDRHPTNGIRLVRNTEGEEALAGLRGPVERTVTRDYRVEVPVADAEFEVFRRMYAYDRLPLNPQVERADTFEHWVREIVRFEVPYGERGGVVLFLPKDAPPPFQPILLWGGSGLLNERSSADVSPSTMAFLVLDGRALAVPIFKGAYERDDSLFSFNWASMPGGREGPTWRDYMIYWQKDLSGTIDYLQTREDMDAERVGFLGHSFGGMMGPVAMAVEPRIRAGALRVGGLYDARFMPEADPVNYVPRVRTPTLMLNGEHDIVFSYETQQLPMFQRLGTRPEDKRHVVTPSAHTVPQDVFIRETLAWFDKYLGAPGGG